MERPSGTHERSKAQNKVSAKQEELQDTMCVISNRTDNKRTLATGNLKDVSAEHQ